MLTRLAPALAAVLALGLPQAADASEPSWTITVDPLTTALGFGHVQVERKLSDHFSLYAGPSLRVFDGISEGVNGPYRGLGLEVGGRCFPWGSRAWGSALEGPWVMLRGVGAHLQLTDGSKQQAFGGYTSGLVGGTAILGEHFVLSGGAGLSWFSYEIGGYGPTGFLPALHTNLGVAL